MSINETIRSWFNKKEVIKKGGGETAIEKQYEKGKLTARDRINALLDKNTFLETDLFVEHGAKEFGLDKKKLAADGVITGIGRINNKKVCVYAQDFTVAGGSLGKMHALKITKIMDLAVKAGVPVVGINDSGGARIQEGVDALAGYGDIFYRNTLASGVIPQISVILGPCAGGAVYSPALTDFVFMVRDISNMFITGPQIIKTVLGEDISKEELGGAETHFTITGNAHFISNSEQETFKQIRKLFEFLPSNYRETPQTTYSVEPNIEKFDVTSILPENPKKPYDIRDIVASIVDKSEFFEVQSGWASNIVVGFAHMDGKPIGIVANQPLILAGVLDVDSSDKAARFVRFCDSFNIPLLSFVDMPGYLPGIDQEYSGVIRHGAKLLYSYSEATVPKLTLIIRKAYGGGYIAMCSKHLGADVVYAWPTAEIAVMGPEGAANIIFRKEILNSPNPAEMRKIKIKEYTEKFANPYIAASRGYVDAVINPDETRKNIILGLNFIIDKKKSLPDKKHGNIPL